MARNSLNMKIAALALEGWTPTEIAQELDITPNHARVSLSQTRKRKAGHLPAMSLARITLTQDERAQLDNHAAIHGVPADMLARAIIVRVIDDGLLPIVLGGDPAEIFKKDAA